MRPSVCDSCGRKHHAARGRYQQCSDCERRYCLECMIGGGVVEFGDCPQCPGQPTLELESREQKPTRAVQH